MGEAQTGTWAVGFNSKLPICATPTRYAAQLLPGSKGFQQAFNWKQIQTQIQWVLLRPSYASALFSSDAVADQAPNLLLQLGQAPNQVRRRVRAEAGGAQDPYHAGEASGQQRRFIGVEKRRRRLSRRG